MSAAVANPHTEPVIGISNLPNQRYKIVYKRGATFTIMLAGESGLGKTTFINTLMSMSLKPYKDDAARHQTPLKKTVEIEITKAILEEKEFTTRVNIIDTPGFGDNVNNKEAWQPIVEYIDDQHDGYMRQEQQPDRRAKLDLRVHVCLYFIRPTGHALKPLDIAALKALGTRVNVIPVIAKADSLSPKELAVFKQRIVQIIKAQNIRVFEPREDAGRLLDHLPFAVIGSEGDVTRADGTVVKGRVYPWGIVEVDNEEHCDFKKLHRLLIREHMLDLINATEEVHYENYRAQSMSSDGTNGRVSHARSREQQEFKEQEQALRKSLTQQVKNEEARFKKWEADLIAKRDQLNKDLADAHVALRELEVEYEQLALKYKR